jgi:hypothetical protein
MNLFCFLPPQVARRRLKLGVYLCAVFMATSMLGLAQSQSQSQPQSSSSDTTNSNGATPTINNPQNHNVSTGNYIPPSPPSGPNVYYNHRWDLYGGFAYTNFLAGPELIQRSNLGGWEATGTYWLGWHWGLMGDARQYIGTSGVFPNTAGPGQPPYCTPYSTTCYNNRTITGPRIMQFYFMAGPEYRVFRRAKASGTFHATFGNAWGIFDAATLHGLDVRTIGLFPTQWTFSSAIGGTFDYNYTPRIAFRAQPELLITRYSGTAQQNFGFSVGPIFRLGHLDTSGGATPSGSKHWHLHNPFHK